MNPLRRLARFISSWPLAPLIARGVLLLSATVVLARIGQGALHRLDEVAVPPVYAQTAPSSVHAHPQVHATASVAAAASATPVASASTGAVAAVIAGAPVPHCHTRGCADGGGGITSDGRVILNRANLEEFITLPGVGRRRAEAIVALRKRLGRFRRVRDLLRVRGIGFKSLRKLKPLVVVDPPKTPPTGK